MIDLVCCGAINWDINLFVRRIPNVGEEVEVLKVTKVPGGTGANVSVAAARILGSGRVALIGALGDDEIGRKQIEILEGEGVKTSSIKIVEGKESGQAYILIDEEGNNVINTFLGANRLLLPEDLDRNEINLSLKEAKVVVVMDPPLETAKRIINEAHRAKRIVIWDPGLYVEMGLKKLSPILNDVDYFILNEIELEKLTGTTDPRIVKKMIQNNLIIKQGSKGSTLVKGHEAISISAVPLNEFKLKVVNTTGCGDVFIGAFASFKALNFDDEEAIKRANCAAAIKATRYETRGGPTFDQLEDFYGRVKDYLRVRFESW
ncbi:MAG: ribokinase [Nitrososphaerales archaeon]|nr:ribokinase [Nitrososphaerales archaeon]